MKCIIYECHSIFYYNEYSKQIELSSNQPLNGPLIEPLFSNRLQYSEEMNNLSNKSIKQPRNKLIASIQCESKKIKQLEAENLELKSTLQDYELVMKLMSQKYRNHISKLISHLNAEENLNVNNVINIKYKQKIEEQNIKINSLTNFIQRLLSFDIDNFLEIQKQAIRTELENDDLRKVLKVASAPINPPTREVAVQADGHAADQSSNESENVNSVNENNLNNTINELINDSTFNNTNEATKFNELVNDIINDLEETNLNESQKVINDLKVNNKNELDLKNDLDANKKSNNFSIDQNCATIKKVIKGDSKKINTSKLFY